MKNKILLLAILSAGFLFSACSNEEDQVETASITDYSPFIVGKYIPTGSILQ